jgi:S1-C subfamily serine protease
MRKVKNKILFLMSAVFFMSVSCFSGDGDIKKSVVKIFTTQRPANYDQPWQMDYQRSVSGSGAIIEGKRIITNAHVISDEVFIQVKKAGDSKKYTAKLEFVAHDCELALLKVEDESFFKGTKPLKFGTLPKQRDKVVVYGFPKGGEELSITEGVVSRIQVGEYPHSKKDLLEVQTDAAINPGNSGGPVIKDGRIVGVAYSSLSSSDTENIGYMVPVPIIGRFFNDIKDLKYDGVSDLGIYTQKMENEDLRKFYKIPQNTTGILVKRVLYGSSAWGNIEKGDIITAINGTDVGNDKTVVLRKGERVRYDYIISKHQIGEKISVDIIRNANPLKLTVKLKSFETLVEGPFYDKEPSYYVFAGLIFTKLTKNFINLWNWKYLPAYLEYKEKYGRRDKSNRDLVLISYVLPHEVNVGYHDLGSQIISSINGIEISSMEDVVKALKNPVDGYHIIKFDNEIHSEGILVLDAKKVEAANKEILERFKIAKDRSDDLMDI